MHIGQEIEPIRGQVTTLGADRHREAGVHQGRAQDPRPLMPEAVEDLRIERLVRHLPEQVGLQPAAGRPIAADTHQGEALVLDGDLAALQEAAQLIVLKVAVERRPAR